MGGANHRWRGAFFGFYPQPVFNYFKTEKCYERKIILVLLMVTINKN